MIKKPLFWSNVAAFTVTGLVLAGVAFGWNSPSSSPTASTGAISADSSGNVVLTGLCFGGDCRGSWPMSNIQAFTTPGAASWTVPAGVKKITVEVWGGGGGGYSSAQSGGGAGGYGKDIISVTPGEVLNITVGAGGSTCSSSCGSANNGGATSLSRSGTTLISATGGLLSSAGGSSTAKININGGYGNQFSTLSNASGYTRISIGGNSPRGGSGGWNGMTGTGGSCNPQGIAPGGGGASSNAVNGTGCISAGAGGAGRLIIYY